MLNRDREIISHIRRYCVEIELAQKHFGDDREVFLANPIYRNAVSMPIQQIGELTKHLSDVFIENNTQIPWSQIKGMRDWFAHQYFNMDIEVIWEVAIVDIPPLKAFLLEMLD